MTSAVVQHLARYLSAVETRSGEAIAQELGCSRTAVWKHVEALRNLGIGIDAVAGRGYLLKEPLELLDADSILDFLDPATGARLAGLNIESSIDSTNIALQRLPLDAQHAVVILAEHQVAGRGRRGRQWASPYGRNLYLSLGWKLEKSMSELGCLPLVVALAVAQALSRAGLKDHRVKWPNDLLLDGRKLCGCLVEVQGDTHGPCHAVLGVGINVHMPASELTEEIDQPWTDLQSHIPGCSRNELAAWLIEELVTYLEVFASQGFTPMRELWEQLDDLKGQKVEVFSATGSVSGVSVGVDQTGALMLDTSDGVISLYSGDVTLRKPAQ